MTDPTTALATIAPPMLPTKGETAAGAMAASERAMIEARAIVAMNRPRNFDEARIRILKACERPLFAKIARYSKPVGDRKTVDGLSIRFAEEVRVLWGNMDVSAICVFDSTDMRIYRVTGVDLETNASDRRDVVIEKFVERKWPREGDEIVGSRANSKGETTYRIRANDDALTVKEQASIAKARREVILSLVPADVKEEAENKIVETMAIRDKKDPEAARNEIINSFYDVGVMPNQLEEFIGHPLKNLTPAELNKLRKAYVTLRDGEATWTEFMEAQGVAEKKEEPGKTATQALKEKIKKEDAAAAAKKDDAQEDLLAEDRRLVEEEGKGNA